MLKTSVVVLCALAMGARAQVPGFGWCPEYIRMANFDMSKFLGKWYESQKYFQFSDLTSRCAMANYSLGPDNKFRVSNEVTNRFTGIKRVWDGVIKQTQSKADEGKLYVKYESLPLDPESTYSVLETDYKSYAVLWSCSGIGPVSAQNAWIMTRERNPPDSVLQKAYGVLDKYKISKTFFVKVDQSECEYEVPKKPAEISTSEQPTVAEEAPVEENPDHSLRSASTTLDEDPPQVPAEIIKDEVKPAPVTVPEVIFKTADIVKESSSSSSSSSESKPTLETAQVPIAEPVVTKK